MLTPQEQERYARQIMMPEIGETGQERLKNSRVLVIGAGGLGSPAAYYLAAAGVGTIGIADGDRVEPSNLQRQILHQESRLGQNKADSAAQTLHGLNSHVDVKAYPCFLDAPALEKLVQQYDIVIDAADQLKNKFMINDVCVGCRKALCTRRHYRLFRSGHDLCAGKRFVLPLHFRGHSGRGCAGADSGDRCDRRHHRHDTGGGGDSLSAGQRHTAHRKAAGAGRQPDAVPDSAVPSCFRGVSAAQEMIQTKGAT